MASRNRGGLIAAYKQYKEDARGWGVPEFTDFRTRLWALRPKRRKEQWSDEDMMYVMTLEEEGAGRALQTFFGETHPVVREILGEERQAPEPMAKDELDGHMRSLIRDCLRNGWTPGEFMAFIDYLDSSKTPADLEREKATREAATAEANAVMGAGARKGLNLADAASGDQKGEERDHFAEAYRAAGKGYQRHVRELLAKAADKVREAGDE